MILHTGGLAWGEISTKSNSNWSAKSKASFKEQIFGSKFSPTTRTIGDVMYWLIRCAASFFLLGSGRRGPEFVTCVAISFSPFFWLISFVLKNWAQKYTFFQCEASNVDNFYFSLVSVETQCIASLQEYGMLKICFI